MFIANRKGDRVRVVHFDDGAQPSSIFDRPHSIKLLLNMFCWWTGGYFFFGITLL